MTIELPEMELPITFVTHSDEDLAYLARSMFASAVQGSKLDLMAYDADKDRQAHWAKEAEEWAADRVRWRQAAGESVVYVRVSISENRQSIVSRRVA